MMLQCGIKWVAGCGELKCFRTPRRTALKKAGWTLKTLFRIAPSFGVRTIHPQLCSMCRTSALVIAILEMDRGLRAGQSLFARNL
jgi:hypothetical protein